MLSQEDWVLYLSRTRSSIKFTITTAVLYYNTPVYMRVYHLSIFYPNRRDWVTQPNESKQQTEHSVPHPHACAVTSQFNVCRYYNFSDRHFHCRETGSLSPPPPPPPTEEISVIFRRMTLCVLHHFVTFENKYVYFIANLSVRFNWFNWDAAHSQFPHSVTNQQKK